MFFKGDLVKIALEDIFANFWEESQNLRYTPRNWAYGIVREGTQHAGVSVVWAVEGLFGIDGHY